MNRPDMPAATHLDAGDPALQQAVRDAPVAIDPARLDALQQRVIADWQARMPVQPVVTGGTVQGGTRGLALFGASRRGWALACGLVLGISVAAGFWLQRPDPLPDELLQPDVLSQMAVGEM